VLSKLTSVKVCWLLIEAIVLCFISLVARTMVVVVEVGCRMMKDDSLVETEG